MEGFVRGFFLLVLETLEAEREKEGGKKTRSVRSNAAGGAFSAFPATSDVNILILHAQLTALTNQGH